MRNDTLSFDAVPAIESGTVHSRCRAPLAAVAALPAMLAINVGVDAAYRTGKLDEAKMLELTALSGLAVLALAMALRLARRPLFCIGSARAALTRLPWLTALALAATVGIALAQGFFAPHRALWYFWTADAVVLVPLAEEMFFRGALQTALNQTKLGAASLWGLRYGTLVAATVFAGAHFALLAAGVAMPRVWFEVGSALPLGVINGLIYQRTGNLWYGFFIHAAGNLAGA